MAQKSLLKKKHFIYSIVLHTMLFVVLFFSVEFAPVRPSQPKLAESLPNKRIVQAGLVNKEAIDKAYERQKTQEQQRKNELERQKRATQLAQQKALQLKKETEKLSQNIAQQKRQAQLELKRANEAKLAAQKARQTEQEAKQAAEKAKALASKKKAEIAEAQKKLKAEQEQRAAREKAQAENAAASQKHRQWLNDEVEKYKMQIAQQIYDNRTLSAAFSADLYCEIHIRLLPDGSINSVEIVKSSGNEAYDNSAEIAVYKAAPFILPAETDLVQKLRDIVLGFKNDSQANI